MRIPSSHTYILTCQLGNKVEWQQQRASFVLVVLHLPRAVGSCCSNVMHAENAAFSTATTIRWSWLQAQSRIFTISLRVSSGLATVLYQDDSNTPINNKLPTSPTQSSFLEHRNREKPAPHKLQYNMEKWSWTPRQNRKLYIIEMLVNSRISAIHSLPSVHKVIATICIYSWLWRTHTQCKAYMALSNRQAKKLDQREPTRCNYLVDINFLNT